MSAYTAEEWHDFLIAAAGAAGALTGLVFLGITINVQRIIAYAGLPARAVELRVDEPVHHPRLGLVAHLAVAAGVRAADPVPTARGRITVEGALR